MTSESTAKIADFKLVPIMHCVVENMVDLETVRQINAEWPDIGWVEHHHPYSQKRGNSCWEAFGPVTRKLIELMNAPSFLRQLSAYFQVEELQSDPLFFGGGLHESFVGGFLGVHADFNIHQVSGLIRRLNLLIFLNEDWQAEWGGSLELHGKNQFGVWGQVREIHPTAGRCVIFETSDHSFHGHPQPLTCPAHRSRRSLALYYYSPQRPDEKVRKHSTLYLGDEANWFPESKA